jgi:hypothetical protein
MYKIWDNYKERWLMNKEMDGNVKNIKNLEYIEKKCNYEMNFYTSDAGIKLDYNEFNEQEKIELDLKLGEILLGLMVLKKNGNMFIKIYTYFERLTVELFIILSYLFEEFIITKPITSKQANSEIYLVCKGYKGKNEEIITLLKNKLRRIEDSQKSFIKQEKLLNTIEEEDLKELNRIALIIYESQINFIERNLYYFDKYLKYNLYNNPNKIMWDIHNRMILPKIERYYQKYISDYNIKRLDDEKKQIIKW